MTLFASAINVCYNENVTHEGFPTHTGKWALLNEANEVLISGNWVFADNGVNTLPWVGVYKADFNGNPYPSVDFTWNREVLPRLIALAIQIRKDEGDWVAGNTVDPITGEKRVRNNYRREPMRFPKAIEVKTWVPQPTKKLMSQEDVAKKFGDLPF